MHRFLADEDLHNDIVRGIKLHRPDIDIVRVQDEGLSGASDPDLLEWAATEDRILITHDAGTMTKHVADRMRSGKTTPKVVVCHQGQPIGAVIDALGLIADENDPARFGYPIRFLSLSKD